MFDADVIINIFNVDKINKDAGRIKALQEYIGESYFDYLAGLPDLVMLMDEAHRYRAKAGMKAVAELKPILGLELTATPKTVGAKSVDFANVIYRYGLAEAMEDGFVKEPAVATRANFNPSSVSPKELERIKLEDGVHAHENVKVELDIYARETGRPLVHPFMLVVAQDTAHAREIRETVEDDKFFGGRYKDRVIEVHSALKGEESDEAAEKLVGLEKDGKTEIVIHVNKLKEGWDVTNLYTIVPLRASASEILTEQTLGRGLRLPYGARTGVEAVDTLTVIAHDRFDEVIRQAREDGSPLKVKAVQIGNGGDVSLEGAVLLESPTVLETVLTSKVEASPDKPAPAPIFDTQEARTVANVTLQVIRQMERELPNLDQLKRPEVQEKIAQRVAEITRPAQGTLEGVIAAADVGAIVATVTTKVAEQTIEIPEIVVLPTSEVTFSFSDFDLTGLDRLTPQPMSMEITIHELRTERRRTIARTLADRREERFEDYLVTHLIDHDEVDYDATADLLYKLAGQMVAHLRGYLSEDDDVENVLLTQGKMLADTIFSQMMAHYVETPTRYVGKVSKGFTLLKPLAFKVTDPKAVRDFRKPVVPAGDTRKHVFDGFTKCVFPHQSFQSNEERLFAVLIDTHEPKVERWVKPGPKQFQIEYRRHEKYEPDFVVETATEKLIVEIKARKDMTDDTVQAKATAARTWVGYATRHAASYGGKPWRYVLIPHDEMTENATLAGLVAKFNMQAIVDEDVALEAAS
ncbi:hypothetical protein XM1_2068 [Magnetospirillum sp. XM-1]|uniref:DEAD/DEAH box helicase n=1 Tax=Magnetospirillum sp. XM-1 TaxID=1663591 RepID=UPI00073DC11F|nr:DEAD/DEAH box helicase family protein [Magnetospirillum sp. XM-1]CUW39137.1 hypothetical protein XM1_2068 [Magnetospirillum sp. XM-1]